MALSSTGISSVADWDCSRALDALLAGEDGGGGESVVPCEFSLLQETGTGEISNRVGCGGRSPLYSPSSDVGSTQSVDSGFSTSGLVRGEDDQFLAGVFGDNFSDFDFLSCDPCGSSLSLSLADPSVPAPLTPPRQTPDNGSPPHSVDSVPSSIPVPVARQNSMLGSDFDLNSPPTTPSSDASRVNTKKMSSIAVDKSRKNAEAARQNRLKKKKYVEELEQDQSKLRAENVVLKTRCTELTTKNRKLETEVAYLRSVLANQSTLSTLIQNIPGTPGVNLTSSFSRKRPGESAGSVPSSSSSSSPAPSLLPPTKRSRGGPTGSSLQHSGGVCLHVAKDNVSLEFCAQCSLKSAQV